MTSFTLRVGSRIQARIGLKKDGTITGIRGKWFVDSGYYSFTTQCQVAVGLAELMLFAQCPHWDLKADVVATNRNASGATRGFGGQELNSSFIPVLSLGMEKAGLDPLEVLKKNFIKPGGGYFWRNGEWYDYRGIDFTNAMDRGAERFGWKEKWKGWLEPSSIAGRLRRGVGVGIHGNADIGEDTAEAYVQLDYEGTAAIFLCAVEHGTGQKSNYSRLVAEVLQIHPERITMTPADTRVTPFEFGPVGSRGTYAIGSAVIHAAEDARRQLLETAATRLGVPADELDTANGVVFEKNKPEKKVRWSVLGNDRTILGYGRFEQDFTMCNCFMSFVELEIDTETGQSRIVRIVNATDIGQIIDPPGLENQMNACWGSAGIDGALMEETILDRKTGNVLNANLVDYCWRPFPEIPDVENVILETPFPSNRFHAVGIAEITNAPGPSAVLMAASNAIGKWLFEYPVTPARILEALEEKDTSGRSKG